MKMATGETVINSSASSWLDSHFGSEQWHMDLNNMRIPSRGFSDGGRVGNFSTVSNYRTSNSQHSGDTHVYVLMNEDELRKRLLADDKGRRIIVDHFRNRRLDLGIA